MSAPVTRRRAMAASAAAAIGTAMGIPITAAAAVKEKNLATAVRAEAVSLEPDAALWRLLALRADALAAQQAGSRAADATEAGSLAHRRACRRCDALIDALIAVEGRIHDTPARTLAGLIAKARVEVEVAERAELDEVEVAFLREVAAFPVPTC